MRRSLQTYLYATVVVLATSCLPTVDACTAMVVGAKASTNRAPMSTHTADCSNCDYRLAKVPAQTHEPGSQREIEVYAPAYPRFVGDTRGDVYKQENLDNRFYNWTTTESIGSIPQVPETYAYLDGIYGIVNEHNVAMGESTCGGRFVSTPAKYGGDALFDVAALTRVALERTRTARESIQLMGDLAVKYGYYGAVWTGENALIEAGEALTISDPTEGWMFHILPDDTGKSAVWVAQRVPDDHIAVCPNQFVIHEVDLNDTDSFMASPNLYEVAIRNNLWSPDSGIPFDFAAVYSPPVDPSRRGYTIRRVWRIFSLVNPEEGAKLDPNAPSYPFSMKVTKPLSPHDLMRFNRDHYEGTQFDMTKGAPGGPYGDPDRYDGAANGDLTKEELHKGRFERAISIFRASYSFVTVMDPKGNTDYTYVWFGQYGPHATVYAPVYVKVDSVPEPLSTTSLYAYDRNSSFWASAVVGNWAARFYKYAHPHVEETQLQLESSAENVQVQVLAQATKLKEEKGENTMRAYLTQQTERIVQQNLVSFQHLFERLVTIYHDGYEMYGFDGPQVIARPLFYPKWWLQLVGFFGNNQSASTTSSPTPTPSSTPTNSGSSFFSTALVILITGVVGVVVGIWVGKKQRSAYVPIL